MKEVLEKVRYWLVRDVPTYHDVPKAVTHTHKNIHKLELNYISVS